MTTDAPEANQKEECEAMKQQTNIQKSQPALGNAGRLSTRKLVLTAMFTCLAFVLNTFVYFPAMAPFQHFVNVLAAALVGPWYGSAAGALCGVLRMLCGRDIGSVTGAMFGPILGGLLYRKFGTWWSVWIGEIIGTGIIGAIVSYPVMALLWGRSGLTWMFYVPSFIAGTLIGGSIAFILLTVLQKNGALKNIQQKLGVNIHGRLK